MSGIKAAGDRLATIEIWRDQDGSIRGRLRSVEPGVFDESPADLQGRVALVGVLSTGLGIMLGAALGWMIWG